MRSLLLSALLASAAAAAACNPYDPDLGETPFRCGADDACPDGYTCVTHSASRKLCERDGDGGDDDGTAPDATQGFACNDDSIVEPNDSTSNAVVTSVPSSGMHATYTQLAICPEGDLDVFRFGVQGSIANFRVTVIANRMDGDLRVKIMNGSGATIGANGAWLDDNHLRIVINNQPIGTYYAEVSGANGAQNNYELEIVTCNSGAGAGSSCPDPT